MYLYVKMYKEDVMKIQEILYNELSNDESVKEQMIEITENNHTQKVKKQRVVSKQKEVPNDESDEVDDTPITAQQVLEYLESRGMQKTPVNYDCAKKFLMENRQANKVKKVEWVEEIEEYEEEEVVSEKAFINHLDSFTEDDLKTLLDVCVLRKLNELTGPFEYEVVNVDASDATALSKQINTYAEQGYHVKNMTGNGAGKMTILFEKPKKREKFDFL